MSENQRFQDESVDIDIQNQSGSEFRHHGPIPFHSTHQVVLNPQPPDFTYLTPYVSSADLQQITPGPLYEIHYHYNNQSREQSEPHYPIIPPNYGYHPYNYSPIMHHPGHFFHNRFITSIHPPPHTLMPGTLFYPHYWHGPDPQFASHFENNPQNTNQQLSEEEMTEKTGDEDEQKNLPYIVQEPNSPRMSPIQSDMNFHRTEASCHESNSNEN